MEQSFGQMIRKARRDKGYSQRQLAELVHLDFTYLSKLENDRAEHPPSEKAIRLLAQNLDLPNVEELIYRASRIPELDENFLMQHPEESSTLLRRMRNNPTFAQRIFREAAQPESEDGLS